MTQQAVLVEACVYSLDAARAAIGAGAARLELCGPGDGGTTPSVELVNECVAMAGLTGIPVRVMIRPRTGNFVYTDDELAAMLGSIAMARRAGADGVVFGVLSRTGLVPESELSALVAAARAGGATPFVTVFHKAFDAVRDAERALDVLMSCGVDAVLTSGGAATAQEGAAALGRLVHLAQDRVQFIAGGSVRGHNVVDVVERSRVREVHALANDAQVIRDIVQALHQRKRGELE